MKLASPEPVEVLHGDMPDAEFCKLLAQVGNGTPVGLVQLRSNGLDTGLVLFRNLEGIVFFVLLEPSIIRLLLGIDFK